MTIDSASVQPASAKRSRRQWAAACETRLRKGARFDDLVHEIVQDGSQQPEAQAIVDTGLRAVNRRAGRVVGCSALLLLGGIVVTIATYSTAVSSGSGGTYYVWWGAMLFGAVGIIYGLTTFARRK
jgi:hypothetical protein